MCWSEANLSKVDLVRIFQLVESGSLLFLLYSVLQASYPKHLDFPSACRLSPGELRLKMAPTALWVPGNQTQAVRLAQQS